MSDIKPTMSPENREICAKLQALRERGERPFNSKDLYVEACRKSQEAQKAGDMDLWGDLMCIANEYSKFLTKTQCLDALREHKLPPYDKDPTPGTKTVLVGKDGVTTLNEHTH